MQPGEVIADRFELVQLAGAGGAGEVWQARDRVDGARVALKLLHAPDTELEAFAREALILSEVRHPGVVRYLAHGVTRAGHSYLVMEWLDGEDLAQRLLRGALGVRDAVALLRAAADGLAAAHRRGVVHRDVKPSNLFLPGGAVERTKLLDFGIAKSAGALRRPGTRSGSVVGTPFYMAPEQARGEIDVDARADVFALGCVAFECLTGVRAFEAEHAIAAFAKILIEDVPRVAVHRRDVPARLDELVQRMLSKDRALRPRDALEVADALEECADLATLGGDRSSTGLTRAEQRILGVVLVPATSAGSLAAEEVRVLQRVAEQSDARFDHLGDGSIVALLSGPQSANDLAARGAHCALAMRAALPHRPIALTMARRDGDGPLAGRAIDSGVRLLLDAAGVPRAAESHVAIDDVTAGLLDARFEVAESGGRLVLRGERELDEAPRTLLGRATGCIGRERELASLWATFEECATESVARAVQVIAPAGVGKSRLRNELVARLRRESAHPSQARATVWTGRGDPMRSGSAFGLATQMLHRACGLSGGEPVEERRRRLLERIARHVRVEPARVAEFLGEMLGIPFDDRGRPQLRAARQDPVLLGDQMRRAFEDFVRAESEAAAVVLVLEDLHWGDQASVQLLDAVLRNLRQRPIMVLALARPEIHDRFPQLWAERGAREVRLAPLTTRASTRLVREALGAEVSDETVQRIVDRAGGNAFYLEELVRAVAAGRGDALPETIVATVQARLERLDPGARRVLRAASVFGETFWSGGAAELLASAADIGEWLTQLADEELVVRRPVARLAAQDEYAFRHALLREGAYAMLTEEDRALGHRLAGEWLHRSGERDAMVLAEHFELGGNLERAVRFYPRAAEQALEGNDLEGVLARVKRGIACGAAGMDLGALRATQSEAHNWRGENAEGEQCALHAMGLVQAGSALWYAAAREAMITALKLGHRERIVEVAGAARAMPPIAAAENARRMALGWAAMSLLFSGSSEEARAILDEIDAGPEHATERDARVEAVVSKARAVRAAIAHEPEGIELLRGALDGFEEAGDLRNAATTRVDVGVLQLDLGAYEEAARLFQRSLEDSERMNLLTGISQVTINLGCALAGLGRFDEAEAMLHEAAGALRAQGHSWMEAAAHMYLARLHLRRHAYDEAQASAGRALALFGDLPDAAIPLACSAQAWLGKGQPASALDPAQRALALLHAHGPLEEGEAYVRLTVAEVMHALGDPTAAAVIAGAEQELLARANRIADPQSRRSFLERVEENSRTLALARQWRLES